MKKAWVWRVGLYAFGIFVMALGALMGNRTGLGVSAINAIPFAVTQAFGVSFATVTLVFYCLFIALQFLLRGKHRRWRDLLQLPFSLAFSALLEFFDKAVVFQARNTAEAAALLLVSILLTAVGISLTISMQIIPNPADGLLETLSWKLNTELGLTKNIEDFCCLAAAFLIDLVFGTVWTSVGVGSVVSMVLLGRTVSLFDRIFRKKMLALAGLDGAQT